MNFKSKCRTWTGNMYHKFEAICHDVDFVGKDNVKYLENQVQIVGEGVKKVYAKVLHDFGPPMAYNKHGKNCVSKKHEKATGSYIRSSVGCSGSQSCQLADSAGDIDCNDYQKNLHPSTSTEFLENPNSLNPEDDENIVAIENHSVCKDLDSGDSLPSYTDSLIVKSNYIERSSVENHLLPMTSESSESHTIFGPAGLSDVGGYMNNAVFQTNASNEDVLVPDVKCLVEEKDYSGSAFYSKENQLLTDDFFALQDENSLSTGLQLIHIDETMCNNIEPYELTGGDSSSDIYGGARNFDERVDLEGKYDETVAVEYTSRVVKYEKPCALYMDDEHLMAEASNFLENEFSEHGKDIHPDTYVKFELIPDYLGEGREEVFSDDSEQVGRADTCESSMWSCLNESVADNLILSCKDTRLNGSTSTSNSGCGDESAVDLDDSIMENLGLSKEVKAEDEVASYGCRFFPRCRDDSAVDLDASNMENVDLINKVTAEEASLVNDWLVHRASCRPRTSKSYKRLVLDALRSRQQMIKEYEQLAILCGDIDVDAGDSLRQEHSDSRPPVAAVGWSAGPSPTNDSCEPGWELV